MGSMPVSRALLAVDVVGSSSTDDDLLADIPSAVGRLLQDAFQAADLDIAERTNPSATGDGGLMSFPETFLPGLVDLAHHLEIVLYQHNRRHKPEIPMRLSVHAGPMIVTDEPTFQRPYIELTRMLEADELKTIVSRCREDGSFTLALILSDHAHRLAVRGRHTTHLRPHHFAELPVRGKNFEERCWLYIPGFDAARIAEFAQAKPSRGRQPNPGSGTVIGNSIHENTGTAIANFGTWQGNPR